MGYIARKRDRERKKHLGKHTPSKGIRFWIYFFQINYYLVVVLLDISKYYAKMKYFSFSKLSKC